jgi:hypothetical protein
VVPLGKAELDARIAPDHDITPPEAQRLWAQVLRQALVDAFDTRVEDHGDDLTASLFWFDLKNPDYIMVCENAGYDPEVFMERFTLYLQEQPRRATPAGL